MSERRNSAGRPKWGVYLATAVVVAAICTGVMFYIGWFNNKTHVDSPNGDNVTHQYRIETAHPEAPGENDWQNPEKSSLREVITEHAEGTETGAE